MAKGEQGKKYRGRSRTHGAGRKARRGAGLKGGRGRAGANKHRFVQLQIKGGKHPHLAAKPYGRTGFTSKSRTPADITINVGDLKQRLDGAADLNLTELGYTKLLGSGTIDLAVTVTVVTATATAISKIEAAGGSVVVAE
jgi:large subunit ribosomal protein L15